MHSSKLHSVCCFSSNQCLNRNFGNFLEYTYATLHSFFHSNAELQRNSRRKSKFQKHHYQNSFQVAYVVKYLCIGMIR